VAFTSKKLETVTDITLYSEYAQLLACDTCIQVSHAGDRVCDTYQVRTPHNNNTPPNTPLQPHTHKITKQSYSQETNYEQQASRVW
jgi:hypothetical protein